MKRKRNFVEQYHYEMKLGEEIFELFVCFSTGLFVALVVRDIIIYIT